MCKVNSKVNSICSCGFKARVNKASDFVSLSLCLKPELDTAFEKRLLFIGRESFKNEAKMIEYEYSSAVEPRRIDLSPELCAMKNSSFDSGPLLFVVWSTLETVAT